MNPRATPVNVGIILLNFGEPDVPDEDRVTRYLERIFRANTPIENHHHVAAEKREQTLAERPASGLVREYNAIGGSPLIQQSRRQAAAFKAELQTRGFDDVTTYVGVKSTEPFFEDAFTQVINDEFNTLIQLSGYPFCGPSTIIAAVRALWDSIEGTEWGGIVGNFTGWNRHPRYLDEGSCYIEYVTEWCELIDQLYGMESHTLGYLNHESQDVPWTDTAVEDVIREVDADRVVVDPVSFIHEQIKTLHPTVAGFDPRVYQLEPCTCTVGLNALCLNDLGDG